MTASDKSADQLKNVLLCRGYPHMPLVVIASNGGFQPFYDLGAPCSIRHEGRQPTFAAICTKGS